MNNCTNELSYDDYLSRINIQELLRDAGYVHYRRDGTRYPTYVRLDSEGRRIRGDKFIVTANGKCCFHAPELKRYNVVSFIKSFPEMFREYSPELKPDRLVNLVCRRILNEPEPERTARIVDPVKERKPFSINNYSVTRMNPSDIATRKEFYPYFKGRGIDLPTQLAFSSHFFLASKKRKNGLTYTNLSFPLVLPSNTEKIVGLEERGRPKLSDGSSYKGKAEGSNSSEGLWIANLTGRPLDRATEIVWFESAYDAMAEYQINPQPSVYVSTGGTPTENQIRGMLARTPNARHYLGFDKDVAGRLFVKNFKFIASKMGFRTENVQSYHPPGCYKDWNDALLGKVSPELKALGNTESDELDKEVNNTEQPDIEPQVGSCRLR